MFETKVIIYWTKVKPLSKNTNFFYCIKKTFTLLFFLLQKKTNLLLKLAPALGKEISSFYFPNSIFL